MSYFPEIILATLLIAVVSATGARADDLSHFQAEIEALERKSADLEPGDGLAGNELLKANADVQTRLMASPAKGTPEWKAIAKRTMDLDKRVRERLEGPLPAGNPGRHAVAAKAALDEAEAALAKLKPGDAAGAKSIQAVLKRAFASLSAATGKARETSLWKECHERALALDKRILARHAGTDGSGGGAAPSAPAPSAPAPSAPAPAGPSRPPGAAPAAGPDGLDLDADPTGLPSTDLYYWRQFAVAYNEALAELRAGRLPSETAAKGALGSISSRDHAAVKRAQEILARFEARLAEARAQAARAAADEKARLAGETAEVDRVFAELDRRFQRFPPPAFSARFAAPTVDAAAARAWIAKLREWEALRADGVAAIAKLKANPRYAKSKDILRLEKHYATWVPQTLEGDFQASTRPGGPIRTPIDAAASQPQGGWSDDFLGRDPEVAAMDAALAAGARACEALGIVRVEYEGRPLEPELAALPARFAGTREKLAAAAQRSYEAVRMPAAATADRLTAETARAAVVDSGSPGVLRVVVTSAPAAYTEDRESRTEAGGGMIQVETWTEKGERMQCTAAEKVGPDVRLVSYSLKRISAGHPSSPRNVWFSEGRHEGRRIKLENVDK